MNVTTMILIILVILSVSMCILAPFKSLPFIGAALCAVAAFVVLVISFVH
jgi:hypothetical protein